MPEAPDMVYTQGITDERQRITKAAAAWLDEWRDEMSSDAHEWIDELLNIIEGQEPTP